MALLPPRPRAIRKSSNGFTKNAVTSSAFERRNTSERVRSAILYREEPPEADTYGRRIAIKLQAVDAVSPPTTVAARKPSRSTPGLLLNPATSSSSRYSDYYKLDKRYIIPNGVKTAGHLDRDAPVPVINTMSGYSQSKWNDTVLDNQKWTDEVLALPRGLNIKAEKGHALNVEKQLLAYYVAKHVLLDTEENKQQSCGEDIYLSHVKPPKPQAAIIMVNKDTIYDNCENLFSKVRKFIQVDITLKCSKMRDMGIVSLHLGPCWLAARLCRW
ncbi:MAG: hypothetical protein Q9184_007969 [Pyrenodesmia sp. 2 TL-2023]